MVIQTLYAQAPYCPWYHPARQLVLQVELPLACPDHLPRAPSWKQNTTVVAVIVQTIFAGGNCTAVVAVAARFPASVDLPPSTYFLCLFETWAATAVKTSRRDHSTQDHRPNTQRPLTLPHLSAHTSALSKPLVLRQAAKISNCRR